MQATIVRGSFITEDRQPIDSVVEFIPDRFWIWENGEAWATLAPRVALINGKFSVKLTSNEWRNWGYTVWTPAGKFHIRVPMSDKPVLLKELIQKSHT